MKEFTIEETARLMDVSTSSVRRWIREEKLAVRKGKTRKGKVITLEDLRNFCQHMPKYISLVESLENAQEKLEELLKSTD